MLLTVSFYVILTTLPATLVYMHPTTPGGMNLMAAEISVDPVWARYFHDFTVRKIVDELCISNYACNLFLYLSTRILRDGHYDIGIYSMMYSVHCMLRIEVGEITRKQSLDCVVDGGFYCTAFSPDGNE